jgi:hypothetical protein
VAAVWLGGSRRWAADLLTGWAMIGCGLAGWARRPGSRSGALLAAAGFAWFVPDFAASGGGPLGWWARMRCICIAARWSTWS